MADLAIAIKIAAEDAASGPIDKIKGALGGLGNAVTAPGKAIGGLISGLGSIGLAAQGLAAVGGAAASMASGLVSGNAQMETFETQLGTMMGSTTAAKDRIKELAKIGAETPFELPQLVAAEKIMMGFGLNTEKTMKLTGKSLDEYRTSMGDMAAGTGTDLSEITNLWAKFGSGATGESLARLQELGIVTKEQLSEVGIQFSKSGELLSPLPEAMSAAMKIADEKFGGGMKALSATFDGQMSTLADNFNQAKTLLMQPLFEVLKEGLTGVNALLSSEAFQTGLTGFAEAGAAALSDLIAVVSSMFEIFQGGVDAGAAGEFLREMLPASIVESTIDLLINLGGVFERVMSGDIPTAISYAIFALEDVGGIISGFLEDWASQFAGWVDSFGPEFLTTLSDMAISITAWLFETGLEIVEKLGAWAAAFVDWIGPKIPDILRELGSFAAGMLEYVGGTALPLLISKLAGWGLAFIEWIAPKIQPMLLELGKLLGELGTWAIDTALPAIVAKLGAWAGAFIEWIGPKIPPMLLELGKLLKQLGDWVFLTALPAIVLKLADWGAAFLGWVAKDVIPTLPQKLGAILTDMGTWMTDTALPGIVAKLVAWGGAFLNFVAVDVIPTFPTKLGLILTAITDWVDQKKDGVATALSTIGQSMLKGIQDGIGGALDGLWNWLRTEFIEKIPAFVRKILDINSPSGVFEGIGTNIVAGLRVGLEKNLPSVSDLIRNTIGDLGGEVGDSGGKVRSHIVEAATERGIDPRAALAVARHEGGEDDYMRIGKFATGWSFWPFQLHYGGKGYEHFGTTAGMGNDFTRQTKWQPGDWRAWEDSIDFGLDHAKKHGWGAWYGRGPAGIGEWEGIKGYADGGWITEPVVGIGMNSGRGYTFRERGEDELVVPRSRLGQGGGGGRGDTINIYGVQPESVFYEAARRQRRQALLGSVRGS